MPARVVEVRGHSHTRPETLTTDTVTVATAGVRVQLSSQQILYEALIQASAANAGDVFVGGDDVDSTNGMTLEAREALRIDVENLNKIWIDAANNGDSVRVMYYKP